jgi:DNA-binding Lrp family transcriptional regulator
MPPLGSQKKLTIIDEVDAIILTNLLRESRTSFSRIAEECDITVTAISNRYRRLWKKGIIKGEVMMVNPFSLGYHCVSLIAIISQRHKEDILLEYLEKNHYKVASSKFSTFSKYTATTTLALKTMGELAAIQRRLENNRLIKRADAFISLTETATYDYPDHPENLVVSSFNGRTEVIKNRTKNVKFEFDETNRKIARILAYRSRTPFGRIAEELGITTKTVIQRYKTLRGNVLMLSTIVVDLDKLGFAGALILIRLENKTRTDEVIGELLKIPNLIHLNKIIGMYDMFVHVVFENFSGYFQIVDRISKIQEVEEMEISIVRGYSAWPINHFASLI